MNLPSSLMPTTARQGTSAPGSAALMQVDAEPSATGDALSSSAGPSTSSVTRSRERSVLRRMSSVLLGWVPPLLVIAGLIGLWQLGSTSGVIKPYVLPGPGPVFRSLVDDRHLLWFEAQPTIKAALIGFTIGNSLAILMAVLFVQSRLAERALFPVAVAFKSLPFIALIPVLVLWLGNDIAPKIVIVSFSMFFPTLVNMMRGLRSVDREARELLHSYSANWAQVLVKLRWPASLPYLFSALRIGASGAFLAALVSEWVGADRGLGYFVIVSSSQFEIPRLWATVFIASGLALSAFGLVALVEKRVLRWSRQGSGLVD